VIRVNAETFGVVGDGTTDNYVALAAAVGEARAIQRELGTGVAVDLPAGTLLIRRPAGADFAVYVPNGVELHGRATNLSVWCDA
jgi:polygalacturonase